MTGPRTREGHHQSPMRCLKWKCVLARITEMQLGQIFPIFNAPFTVSWLKGLFMLNPLRFSALAPSCHHPCLFPGSALLMVMCLNP